MNKKILLVLFVVLLLGIFFISSIMVTPTFKIASVHTTDDQVTISLSLKNNASQPLSVFGGGASKSALSPVVMITSGGNKVKYREDPKDLTTIYQIPSNKEVSWICTTSSSELSNEFKVELVYMPISISHEIWGKIAKLVPAEHRHKLVELAEETSTTESIFVTGNVPSE